MSAPESFLSAAKKVADAAGVPWSSEASKVYRDLQAAEWLPKSSGRRVYAAHPNLIAVFLIGLAASSTSLPPVAAVEAFALALKEGAQLNDRMSFEANELRWNIAHLLSHQTAADIVESVEFFADRKEAVITFSSGEQDRFFVGNSDTSPRRLVYQHGVISGDLFRAVRGIVNWNFGPNPMTNADISSDED